MATKNFGRQLYLTLLCVQPSYSLAINGKTRFIFILILQFLAFRDHHFFNPFIKKVDYDISEENLRLFEEELTKVNETLPMPFEGLKVRNLSDLILSV
jgi:hypothetical protein